MTDYFFRLRNTKVFLGELLALIALLALGACGGSEVAGVGSGGTGIATVVDGTVSGFGSVFVDGTEYDDSSASVRRDDDVSGVTSNADLRIGQRVRLELDSTGKVQTATVLPQLVGPVTQAQDASGTLRVMGQWVRLAGSAGDAGHGAMAARSGFSSGAAGIGDDVEVHGSWVYDSGLASYVLIANRIEKLADAADPVLLSGVLQSVAGNTLVLNAANGLSAQAAAMPAAIGPGSLVRLWATRAAWLARTANPGQSLPLARIVSVSVQAATLGDQGLKLSGPVGRFDAVNRTIEIQGTVVDLPASLQLDASQLVPGHFLSLDARLSGGRLIASSANQRGNAGSATDLGQTIVLKAIVSGISWNGSPVNFKLRGVDVTVAQALVPAACRQAGANADLIVEVRGSFLLGNDVVTASEVLCTVTSGSDPMGGAGMGNFTLDRTGVVTQLSLANKSFVLQTAQGNISVQWDARTYFANDFIKHPESLSGQSVAVEGVIQTGILRAQKIMHGG